MNNEHVDDDIDDNDDNDDDDDDDDDNDDDEYDNHNGDGLINTMTKAILIMKDSGNLPRERITAKILPIPLQINYKHPRSK